MSEILHKDLIGEDLHIAKIHADTHSSSSTDAISHSNLAGISWSLSGHTIDSEVVMGTYPFLFSVTTTPSAPAVDQLYVYAKLNESSKAKLYIVDSEGTETELGSGGEGDTTNHALLTNLNWLASSHTIDTDLVINENSIIFSEISTPSTPAANTVKLYSKDSEGISILYMLDSEGTETAIAGAGVGAVNSVFGRTNDVTAETNDYTWAQIDKTTSDIADLTTKSHTSLSDIGTNTHTDIDNHIADVTTNPHSVTAEQTSAIPTSYLDTDEALAADSDSKVATQKATKAYIDNGLDSVAGGLTYKGLLDASGGVYPVGPTAGDYYIISVAGTIDGTTYAVSDWAAYNGSVWNKIDNQQKLYTASNGLTLSASDFKLGGTLAAATTINSGQYNLYYNINGSTTGGFEIQKSGATMFRVGFTGQTGIGITPTTTAQLIVAASTSTIKSLIVRGATSQTSNLQDWQNSAGTVLAYVDSNGFYTSSQTVDQSTLPSVFGNQAPTVFESSTTTGTSETFDQTWEAIKFTAASSHASVSFGVRLKVSVALTNATSYITGYIYTDVAGSPGVPYSATATYVRYSQLTTSYAEYYFHLGSTTTVVSGTSYWLVLKQSSAPVGGTVSLDGTTGGTNTYANSTNGTSWNLESNKTPYYKIYGRTGVGIQGTSQNYIGVYGTSKSSFGGYFSSTHGTAMYAVSHSLYAVYGQSTSGIGGYFTSTNNSAINAVSTSGYGVQCSSTSGSAVLATSSSSYAFQGVTTTGIASYLSTNPTSTNTVTEVARFARLTSGTAAAGIGGYFNLHTENSVGTSVQAGIISWKLTTVTSGSEQSSLLFGTRNGANITSHLTLNYLGYLGVGSTITSPGAPIHVKTGSGEQAIRIESLNNTTYWSIGVVYNQTNSDLIFGVGGTEKFRFNANGSLGIGAYPNANSILDLTSTTRAFLPPRMTTTQKNAISTPTAGMLVYDSTLGALSLYTSSWGAIGGGGSGTPGGSDTQVQFNDASAFGGSSLFTFNKTTGVVYSSGGFVNSITTANVDSPLATGDNALTSGIFFRKSTGDGNTYYKTLIKGYGNTIVSASYASIGGDNVQTVDLFANLNIYGQGGTTGPANPILTLNGYITAIGYDSAAFSLASSGELTLTRGSANVTSFNVRLPLSLGKASVATGELQFNGTTSGTITVKSADVAGTWTLTLPATAGTSGYILSTDGSGVTSWVSPSSGSTLDDVLTAGDTSASNDLTLTSGTMSADTVKGLGGEFGTRLYDPAGVFPSFVVWAGTIRETSSVNAFGILSNRSSDAGGIIIKPDMYVQYNTAEAIGNIQGTNSNLLAAANIAIQGEGGSVYIGALNTDNSGAILQVTGDTNLTGGLAVNSTTKAFLPPRMDTTARNAIASPSAGMLIYDTTESALALYTDSWNLVGGGSGISYSVTDKTEDYAILTSDLGFGNTLTMDASTEKTFTLPVITTELGKPITIVKLGDGKLNVTCQSGVVIMDSSTGGSIYNDTVQANYNSPSITVMPITTSKWIVIMQNGSYWTTT